MSAAFGHASVFHHIDPVGLHHIGQTVGNQKYCLCLCQLMNHIHNHLFALCINIRCGLVKNIDRRIVQQRPGNGKSLTLSA